MGWYGDKVEKLKRLPNSYFFLFVGVKVLGGISIGVLLATWLPTWTWWIFLVVALVIAIPLYAKIFSK